MATPLPLTTSSQIIELATKCVQVFNAPQGEADLYARVQGKGVIIGPLLMEKLDELHVEYMNQWGYEGPDALRKLQVAVTVHKDPLTKAAIMKLCDATESLLKKVTAKVAADNNIQLPAEGAQMQQPSQEQMVLMKMAFEHALTEPQRKDMMAMQQKMMRGQMPTPDEQRKMQTIQQALMQYCAMMGPMLAAAKGGAGATAAAPPPPPPSGAAPS